MKVWAGYARSLGREHSLEGVEQEQMSFLRIQGDTVGAKYLPPILRGEPVNGTNPSPDKVSANPELAGVR
jgi:hypothetical protein